MCILCTSDFFVLFCWHMHVISVTASTELFTLGCNDYVNLIPSRYFSAFVCVCVFTCVRMLFMVVECKGLIL